MSSLMTRIKLVLKHNDLIYRMLHPVLRGIRCTRMRFEQSRYGIDPKKVVFSAFLGEKYGDNPRYISERLHELCPDCRIVWTFGSKAFDKVETPDYVKKVRMLSKQDFHEQATARFWVDNYRRPDTYYLDGRQYYINTWHGDRGFKRVGDDNEKQPWTVFRIEDKCSMMIAGSEFGRSTYRTAFHFQGEVLMDGCPRNDILLRNDPMMAERIRVGVGIPKDAKVLIYAPTYRDDAAKQDCVLDIPRTLDHLEASKGGNWVCMYRTHYLSNGMDVVSDERILNVTDWPEMSELLLISDMLITDYSSCAGDFTLLRRPAILYHADDREYLERSRSFYFDIRESPFWVARSQEELERLIDDIDDEKVRENCEALDRFFGTTETGHASDAVCRYIMQRM